MLSSRAPRNCSPDRDMATVTATTTPLVSRGEAGAALPGWIRVYAKLLALWTYCVVVAGGIVTSTGSGLADRHWPSFDGRLLPSLEAMAEKLRSVGRVTVNPFLLRLEVDGYLITLFPDGRAIIGGTDDIAAAKTVYAKYVGT